VFEGTTIFISEQDAINAIEFTSTIDFFINGYTHLGSVLLINGEQNEHYISDIQHVRRRETIAMTPINCHAVLKALIGQSSDNEKNNSDKAQYEENKTIVLDSIRKVTATNTKPLLGSSGLSVQYAIMMGLVHDALENHQ
jgi:hypothetical protein